MCGSLRLVATMSLYTCIKRFYTVLPYQLIQEIDLVLGKANVASTTTQQWATKWVPAVTSYADSLSNKKAPIPIGIVSRTPTDDKITPQKHTVIAIYPVHMGGEKWFGIHHM